MILRDALPSNIPVVSGAITTSNPISGFPMQVFDIPQVIVCAYQANTGFTDPILHNEPWGQTGFTLVQGVRNEIYIVVRDHTAYGVDTNGFTLNLTTQSGIISRYPLTLENASKGRYTVAIEVEEVADLPLGVIDWSVSFLRDDLTHVLLWVDRKNVYSKAVVINAPLPERPVLQLGWDDLSPLTAADNPSYYLSDPLYYSSAIAGAAQFIYSGGSQILTYGLSQFSGIIRIDGSLIGPTDDTSNSADWFTVTSLAFDAQSGNDSLVITGHYVWVRVVITKLAGSVDALTLYFPINPSV